MDGILIIDKPTGITSHDVVASVRRILKTKRVGHTGTLDPFATGVMVLLLGKATRLAQFLDKDEKEYEALVQFGFETDTGDRTGVRKPPRPRKASDAPPFVGGEPCGLWSEDIAARLDSTDWNSVFAPFRGEVMQAPPMYSAKKVEGKKLYELARKGVEIERKPVKVTIHKLERVETDETLNPKSEIRIRIVCSAGTYIRVLAEDVGRAVGLGAHLTELNRTRAGRFRIEDAFTLENLEALENPASALLPLRDAISHLPPFDLREDRVDKTRNGMSTRADGVDLTDGESVQMVSPTGEVIAVGLYDESEKTIQPKVVLG